MSNTSTVSPYAAATSDTDSAVDAAEPAVAAATAATIVAVARWLGEDTPADRAAIERATVDQRKERLAARTRVEIGGDTVAGTRAMTSVSLHLRDPETLIRSAEHLGYRLEPLAAPTLPLRSQPHVLLRSAAGERLAMSRDRAGRVVIHTAGDRGRVGALVRRHTADRVADHLAGRGMDVRTATLPNGEVQILAREQSGQSDGAAVVKTQVLPDGTAWVDVDKIRGRRCEEIVRQLADAVGAEVRSTDKKDAYFELPGEPAKTTVKV